MANRKITPLKDEELDINELILEKISEIEAYLSAQKDNESKALSMLKTFDSLPRNVVIAVNDLLEERKKRMDKEATAEDGMTIKELLETINSIVTSFNEKHESAVKFIEDAAKYLVFIKKSISDLQDKIECADSINTATYRSIHVAGNNLSFPTFPDRISHLGKYLFYDVPDYIISRIKHSRIIPRYVAVGSFIVTLIVVSLLIFIGQENAYLRHENIRLRQTEEKYIILRKASRCNAEWSRQADYIDLLYSDPEQNHAEIDRLRKVNE